MKHIVCSLVMKTRTKIIYGTIVGLAVAALAVDRWVIGVSASSPTVAAVRSAVRVAPKLPAIDNSPKKTIATRLRTAVQSLEEPAAADAFALPAVWMLEVKPAAAGGSASDVAADFVARHKLDAVLKGGEGGVAIINGKALTAGKTIDGFTVAEIGPRSATLVGGGVTVEMKLDRPAAKGPVASARG
jgi:hypothetical protein